MEILVKELTESLQALELAQVAITATIDSTGQIGPVGGLWPKLLAAAREAATLGLLRAVVVAAEQHDVPEELQRDDATPLRVIKAATIQEAVAKLYEEHGPRAAVRHYERTQCATIDVLGRSVSLETHYQMLPLLREVKRERLPRVAGRTDAGTWRRGDEEETGELQAVDILRWEEELQAERVVYERVSLDEMFQQLQSEPREVKNPVPRFVVLGPPGSGKTMLAQYLGWQAANGKLRIRGRSLLPVRVRLRDWETWVTKTEGSGHGLPQYLAELHGGLSPAPTAEHWRRWLRRGEVLLLLDGLDEIGGQSACIPVLKSALMTFTACPTVLTCRTVSFQQHKTLCPDFPLFTLAGLDPDMRATYIRAFPAEYSEHYDPEALIDQLNRTFQMLPLAANPLLLSILCYVVDDERRVPLPATRVVLYQRALEKLFTPRAARVATHYPGAEPGVDDKLAITERTALDLFAQSDHTLTCTERELGQALKRALVEEGYGDAPTPWANALRTDLIHNHGILRGSNEQGFFFLHLTVQEFLTAAAIARMVNARGWDTSIEVGKSTMRAHHLLDKKAWDPRWQEVIILLAGQLTDPTPLFSVLVNDQKDDLFHHRLALAALCLPEVSPDMSTSHSAIVDRITTAIISNWLQHEMNDTRIAVPQLTWALPALGQVNGRIRGIPLLQWLCQGLHDSNADMRAGVIEALGQIGAAIPLRPEILSTLLQALHDTNDRVRATAATAFKRIGAAATQHAAILTALIQAALYDGDWSVRSEAAKAIERMRHAATRHSAVLPVLVQACASEEPQVRSRAERMMKRIRGEVTQPRAVVPTVAVQSTDALPQLVVALGHEDSRTRSEAAATLARIGTAAVISSEVLPALLQVALYDQDSGVRSQAIEALGRMEDGAVQHSHTLPTLVALLHDQDNGVRAQAAKALGQMGEASARHADVLPELMAALRDEDSYVRFQTAEALAKIMAQGIRIFRRRWGRVEGQKVEALARL